MEKGTDNYNRLVNQISDMNMEILHFLNKFKDFQKSANIMDNTLSNNLQKLIENIDDFLDGEPIHLDTHLKTKCDIDFDRHFLERVFVCNVCQVEIGVRMKDITRHINEPMHKNFLENIEFINGVKMNPPLKVISKAKEKHIKKKQEQTKKRTEKQNLPKRVKAYILEDFRPFITNSIKEGNIIKNMPLYGQLETSLLNLIRNEFPNAKVHFFGSRINGLGTHDSDLDLFLEIGDVFNRYDEPRENTVKLLRNVFKVLSCRRDEWKNMIKIEDARVPIIRAFNAKFKIECDIAFSNGLAICNTRLIKYLCELQPVCQKMCFFLKRWLDLTALSKQITTYTMILLVVFYLQSQGFLPAICQLQKDLPNCLEIGPWMGNFAEKTLTELGLPLAPEDDASFYQHLRKFFNYYANLSFQNLIICPYLGKLLDKHNFRTFYDAMPRYFRYLDLDPKVNGLQLDKAICVQDPFEQNHNVAKGISDNLLGLLRRFMLLSAQDLADKMQKM